jgi:hypothetical protein
VARDAFDEDAYNKGIEEAEAEIISARRNDHSQDSR